MNSFFLSGSLPPNAEGSAEQSEAKGACLRTQVRIFKSCNLCPDSSLWGNYITVIPIFTTVQEWRAGIQSRSVRKIFCICSRLLLPMAIAATLAKAKRLTHFYSVAPLPGKRFACFPTSGDGLHFLFCSLCTHLTVNTFIKLDCFLP